jgi:hypothetical protein
MKCRDPRAVATTPDTYGLMGGARDVVIGAEGVELEVGAAFLMLENFSCPRTAILMAPLGVSEATVRVGTCRKGLNQFSAYCERH